MKKDIKRKIGMDQLVIELTRWCNMTCAHCLRGEREKLRIAKKYIDRMLDSISYVHVLTLTGGEPTLALDLIEYLLIQCKIKNIEVHNVWCTTNGKIKSNKFLNLMTEFIEYSEEFDGEISGVSLSTDQFHDNLPEENYWFYRDYEYFEDSKDRGVLKTTISEGRAMLNGLSTNRGAVREEKIYLMEDKETYNINEGTIYLNAKGDIIFGCDYSFESQDFEARFNIMDSGDFIDKLLKCENVEIEHSYDYSEEEALACV